MATMSGGGGGGGSIPSTKNLTSNAAVLDRRNTTASNFSGTQVPLGGGKYVQANAANTAPVAAPAPEPAPEPARTMPPPVYNPPQTMIAPPPIPTSGDALNSPDYMAALAALRNASELFSADQRSAKDRFNVDYNKAISDLGWIADPSGGGRWDEGELFTSQGKETASGRAFSNQLNDFASRGLLQSGLFSAQRNALQNEMSDRLGAQEQTRTRFTEDLTTKERNFQSEQERARMEALNAAKQNLMSQYLAQYGGA